MTVAGPAAAALRRMPGARAAAAVGAAAVTGIAAGGAATVLPPLVTLGLAVAGGLALAVALRPALGAYMLLGATPLIVGIDRGDAIPLLRPSELLAAVIAVGLVGRGVMLMAAGERIRPRLGRVDAALLGLLATGSALPLLWMTLRGRDISQDDVLYALQLWKYYAIFLIVRASVSGERQVYRCLWISLAAAAVVAVVAILQALGSGPVISFLAQYYAPFEDTAIVQNARGTSTLSSSSAVADVMVFNLAIATGMLMFRMRGPLALTLLAMLFAFGTVAAGQFAGYLGIAVGLLAIGYVTRRAARLVVVFAPLLALAALALRPVVERRLSGFESVGGLPPSWIARIDNLERHFWPELGRDLNWLFGVRPAARVPAPEPWRDWVFIESGHTWLLWTGGIPFAVAFGAFLWVAMRAVLRVARERADAIGVAALASFTALAVMAVLMIADPHLTLRGSADLSFALLALALAGGARARSGPARS